MLGLRAKILIGFGGLLTILFATSLLGRSVLQRYSAAMQRSFREDYDSVAVCQRMKETVERINACFQSAQSADASSLAAIAGLEKRFEQDLGTQRRDATLAGEKEATERLAVLWTRYRQAVDRAARSASPGSEIASLYQSTISPLSWDVRNAAQDLIDMNMDSVLSVHGKESLMATRAYSAMHWLSISAVGLGVVVALLIGRLVLTPLKLLTESVRQIEQGNLDMHVPVESTDEIGALAAAFNAMAEQLRVYRQREHDRLVRTEHSTQLTLDSLPDSVLVLNPAGRVDLANGPAKRLFHIQPGMTLEEQDRPDLSELHRRCLAFGRPTDLQGYDATLQLTVDGELRYLLPRGVPILDDDRRIIGTTLILADVTGLRRLDEMKNGLLSLVSHELKTPLTSMRMILHLISGGKLGPLSQRQEELLTTAREDSDRLHRIVENLLDMGRIEAGKALMELAPVSPSVLMTSAIEPMKSAFEAQQTRLELQVPDDLPRVIADTGRIGYVIANLLNNALRYTSGGVVRITARALDPFVEFEVDDNGAGIPAPFVHRVLEKFFRVPGQGNSQGAGLGLAIVREIVEAHGGQVCLSSQEGIGTTFRFTLRQVGADHPRHLSDRAIDSRSEEPLADAAIPLPILGRRA